MKSFTSTIDCSINFGWASGSSGSGPQSNSQYNRRQAFCPGAGWMAWGYLAGLHDLKPVDMAQA